MVDRSSSTVSKYFRYLMCNLEAAEERQLRPLGQFKRILNRKRLLTRGQRNSINSGQVASAAVGSGFPAQLLADLSADIPQCFQLALNH